MISYSQEPIVVACAADDFFSMPLAVTSFSALKNLSHDRHMILYILDGGISLANKNKLLKTLKSERLEVRWIKPSEEKIKKNILQLRVSSHPISIYYRLLLPTLIPSQIKKIIYLDSDIVVEGDLAKLWDQEFEDEYLMAVQDPVHKTVLEAEHLKQYCLLEKGITVDHKYLNTGMLVINLEKWRQGDTAYHILKFIGDHPDIPFPDQDAANVVLAGKWRELSPLWNQIHAVHFFKSHEGSIYDESTLSELITRPYIIHYAGKPKPWEKNCIHPQADRYFKYLDQTAWSGWRNNALNNNISLARRGVRRMITSLSKKISQSG